MGLALLRPALRRRFFAFLGQRIVLCRSWVATGAANGQTSQGSDKGPVPPRRRRIDAIDDQRIEEGKDGPTAPAREGWHLATWRGAEAGCGRKPNPVPGDRGRGAQRPGARPSPSP